MRNSDGRRNPSGLIIICVALLACAAVPLSSARSPSTAVTIVNNSSRAIRSVYISHVDRDDWGSNQLGDATIAPGQSFSLNNVACDQQQVKVVGEDGEGCFESTVVSCGDNVTWTITNETARDCGGD